MGEVLALGEMLAARTVWRAGQGVATRRDGEPSGHAALDAALPDGGWPRRALTELLLPSDGVGEIALLLPTLARLTAAGERVVLSQVGLSLCLPFALIPLIHLTSSGQAMGEMRNRRTAVLLATLCAVLIVGINLALLLI